MNSSHSVAPSDSALSLSKLFFILSNCSLVMYLSAEELINGTIALKSSNEIFLLSLSSCFSFSSLLKSNCFWAISS